MPIRALATVILLAATAGAAAQDLDLVNATLVDGTGAEPRRGVTVSVRAGKITAISEGAPAAANGIKRIDLKGRYLLPGLIDAHAHIESPSAALRALQSGVTTARVLGDTNFQALGTRDLVRLGHVPGPELLVSPGPHPAEAGPGLLHGRIRNSETRSPVSCAAPTGSPKRRGRSSRRAPTSSRSARASVRAWSRPILAVLS